MKKIDWDKVWEKFHKWLPTVGSDLGMLMSDEKKKIQSLVEAQLKVKRKK